MEIHINSKGWEHTSYHLTLNHPKLTLNHTLTLTEWQFSSGQFSSWPPFLKLILTLTQTPILTGGNCPDTHNDLIKKKTHLNLCCWDITWKKWIIHYYLFFSNKISKKSILSENYAFKNLWKKDKHWSLNNIFLFFLTRYFEKELWSSKNWVVLLQTNKQKNITLGRSIPIFWSLH